jgi:hypothetical protein
MKQFFVGLAIACMMSSTVWASSNSHRQAAEELLKVSDLKSTMDRMIVQMVEMQIRQKPVMAPYRDVLLQFFNKYLSYGSIKYDFVDIYTEEFNEQELREIVRFYKTPVGKKTITKLPILMQKGAQVGMSKVKSHQNELREMLETESKRLEAENKGSTPAKSSPEK